MPNHENSDPRPAEPAAPTPRDRVAAAVADRIAMTGMSRRQWAKRAGVPRSVLENFLASGGTWPSESSRTSIERALDLQPGSLLEMRRAAEGPATAHKVGQSGDHGVAESDGRVGWITFPVNVETLSDEEIDEITTAARLAAQAYKRKILSDRQA